VSSLGTLRYSRIRCWHRTRPTHPPSTCICCSIHNHDDISWRRWLVRSFDRQCSRYVRAIPSCGTSTQSQTYATGTTIRCALPQRLPVPLESLARLAHSLSLQVGAAPVATLRKQQSLTNVDDWKQIISIIGGSRLGVSEGCLYVPPTADCMLCRDACSLQPLTDSILSSCRRRAS